MSSLFPIVIKMFFEHYATLVHLFHLDESRRAYSEPVSLCHSFIIHGKILKMAASMFCNRLASLLFNAKHVVSLRVSQYRSLFTFLPSSFAINF